ncbi:MAG: hypothetical protein EBQ48_08350 [Betaproteobacteria bacterium]|nr:hypothetical protein [Betaproteobacteria bacterium]
MDTAAPTATVTLSNKDTQLPANVVPLSGTLSAALSSGEKLAFYDGDKLLGFAASVVGTSFSYDTPRLSNGAHNLRAQVVDAAGNLGPFSSVYNVTVAVVATPTARVMLNDSVSLTKNSTPTLSGSLVGRLASGEKVVIYDGGQKLGEVSPATGASSWELALASPLSDGVHALRAVVQNSQGVQGVLSAAYSLAVDTERPTLSVIGNDVGIISEAVQFTLKFSEPVTGLTATDFAVTNGALTELTPLSPTNYRVTVTPNSGLQGTPSAPATIALSLANEAVNDAAGNTYAASSPSVIATRRLIPSHLGLPV